MAIIWDNSLEGLDASQLPRSVTPPATDGHLSRMECQEGMAAVNQRSVDNPGRSPSIHQV